MKYWILKQVDYDYSLLDIDETSNSPLLIGEGQGEVSQHSEVILSDSEESRKTWSEMDSSADKSASEWQEKHQETPIKEPDSKDDEDLKNRAKIFRTF